ncbi:MAG: DinB family protein [Acidimicrobiia bacterium]
MDEETRRLLDSLEQQRNHVLGILEGLSEEQLRRPILPSGWSALGMVKHLALDDEHYWFRCIVAGETLDFFSERSDDDRSAWSVSPSESAADVFNLYRDEVARANAIITATPLDAAPRQRDVWWGNWEVPDFRFIILHVITETACHAGHLDAARELLDGRQWIVL